VVRFLFPRTRISGSFLLAGCDHSDLDLPFPIRALSDLKAASMKLLGYTFHHALLREERRTRIHSLVKAQEESGHVRNSNLTGPPFLICSSEERNRTDPRGSQDIGRSEHRQNAFWGLEYWLSDDSLLMDFVIPITLTGLTAYLYLRPKRFRQGSCSPLWRGQYWMHRCSWSEPPGWKVFAGRNLLQSGCINHDIRIFHCRTTTGIILTYRFEPRTS